MNGVHDMGGMEGLGPLAPESSEVPFHEPWEKRALALTVAAGVWGRWNIDQSRHQRELIPGPDYLAASYYERWIRALTSLLIDAGLVSSAEVLTGRPDPGAQSRAPRLTAERVRQALAQGGSTSRKVRERPIFTLGQAVRARDLNPSGHTRLPRYVRGRFGEITHLHGAHVFPDANAHGAGEQPQALYQVRFRARDLWGGGAPIGDFVYLDLWESYLDAA